MVFGECHLRHVLLSYMSYYNGTRTHLSLNKDTPVSRAVGRVGNVTSHPILAHCITDMPGFDLRQAQD